MTAGGRTIGTGTVSIAVVTDPGPIDDFAAAFGGINAEGIVINTFWIRRSGAGHRIANTVFIAVALVVDGTEFVIVTQNAGFNGRINAVPALTDGPRLDLALAGGLAVFIGHTER